MPRLQENTTIPAELVEYGKRAVRAGLSAGSSGNISGRLGDNIWMKPAGFALDEITEENLSCIRLPAGKQVSGRHQPTSEYMMHVGVYRVRKDVNAVFYVRPPWLTGIVTAGIEFRPLVSEAVACLGRTLTLPYQLPTSEDLVQAVADAVRDHDTILMPHHGMLAVGNDARQAYHRCAAAEDAAKSLVAARVVAPPTFLSESQVTDLKQRMDALGG